MRFPLKRRDAAECRSVFCDKESLGHDARLLRCVVASGGRGVDSPAAALSVLEILKAWRPGAFSSPVPPHGPSLRTGGTQQRQSGKLTAGLVTLTRVKGDVRHGGQMAYTFPPVAYGSGKPKRAPPPAPLPLAEARLSQVEAELRLMLVETEVSRLEEGLSHLEAELADVRNARADESPMLAASPDASSDYL